MKINNGVLNCKIPKRLIDLSYTFSNRKDTREALFKTYSIIYFKTEQERKRNSKRNNPKKEHQLFVSIATNYFKTSISKRYYNYIKFLKKHRFISIKGRELDNYESGTGLLDDTRKVESYKVGEYSKSYRILEYPIKDDKEYSFKLTFKTSIIYNKNHNFLISIGIKDPKITRDNFGFRVYHDLSTTFKEVLPEKGTYIYYDFKTSIPNHIRSLVIDILEAQGISDEDPFLDLFDGDFYHNWNTSIDIHSDSRDKVKKQFSAIIFGNEKDYSPKTKRLIRNKFPLFSGLLNKDFGKKIIRKETKLVLDEVVSKLSTHRVLTIHDGFIIHKTDEVNTDENLAQMDFQDKGFSLVKTQIGKEESRGMEESNSLLRTSKNNCPLSLSLMKNNQNCFTPLFHT